MSRSLPVIWIEEKGVWFPGVVLATSKSPTVFLETGEKRKIRDERIQFKSEATAGASIEDLGDYRARFDLEYRAIEADFPELWQLLNSTPNAKKSYSPEELASFLGEPDENPIWFDAFRCNLLKDPVYFRRRGDNFALVEAHAVQQRERQQRAMLREKKKLQTLAAAIHDATDSRGQREYSEALLKACALLETITLDPEAGASNKEGLKLLEATLGGPPGNAFRAAFDLLVRVGYYHTDELLDLRRNDIRMEFPSDALEWAEQLTNEPANNDTADTPAIRAFTIDDAHSRDLDDAIALEHTETGDILHIMITDVASAIPLDSPVAQEAMLRATTLYLPDAVIPMFPAKISEDALSLVANTVRNVLDFQITLDEEDSPAALEIVPRQITVAQRMTYGEVDSILSTPKEDLPAESLGHSIHRLRDITAKLRRRRNERGAFLWSMDEFKYKVGDSGVSIDKIDPLSQSRILIQELMVLVGSMTASYCMEAKIPLIYRSQKASESPLMPQRPATSEIFAQIITMSAATLDVTPAPHEGLGVPAYVQITSPLRRFQDYLSQLQLRSFLIHGTPAMTRDALMKTFGTLETQNRVNRSIMKEAERYWSLKYYADRGEFNTEALVLQTWARKARIVFLDTGYQMDWRNEREIPAGTTIGVTIIHAEPRAKTLKIRVR